VIVEPDGTRLAFGRPGTSPAAEIRLRSDRFWRAMLGGSVGLGESYRDGEWDCDDLVALTRLAARNMGPLDRWRQRLRPLAAPLRATIWRVPRNTRRAARRHISAHYDLGNELFGLYLDESMMYSSSPRPRSRAWIGSAPGSSWAPTTTCSRSGPGGERSPPTPPPGSAAG
jgi:cyclopropane-fatty-acyl-phospholipid synthase